MKSMERRNFCKGAFATAFCSGCVRPPAKNGVFSFTVLNPDCMNGGAGQCVVMRTPSGRTYLYDTGNGEFRNGLAAGLRKKNNGRDIIAPWLTAHGVREIDGLVLSHYHSDHFGGFLWMSDRFPIKAVWNNGYEPPSDTHIPESVACKTALADWEKRHPGRLVMHTDETTRLGWDEPGMTFEVVWPRVSEPCAPLSGGINQCLHHLLNANSTALSVTVGERRFLIAGDINNDYFHTYMVPHLKAKGCWTADVVVLPAHGDVACAPGIGEMSPKPEIAVASIGNVAWMAHNGPRTCAVFSDKGITTYATNVHGDITVMTDGRSLDVVADPTRLYPHNPEGQTT